MKRFLFLMILQILAMAVLAQKVDYRFRHLTSQQGLPHQQVEALLQDANGNTWIGTRNGLSCYNGYSIRNYYHEEGNPNSLNHNFVKNLFLDSSNCIWVITDTGLCRYNPETDSFKSYTGFNGHVSCIKQMKSGKILCGSNQLYVFDSKQDKFTAYPSLDNSYILSMAVDSHDNLIIVTNSTVFRYDSSLTNISRPYQNLFSDFLTGADAIVALFFDSKDRLWAGRNGKGVFCINPDGDFKIYEASEISDGTVRSITEDSQHNIWLGTEKGITIIKPDESVDIIRSEFGKDQSLSDNAIYTILCDKYENVWVGSYFGGVDILQTGKSFFNVSRPGLGNNNISGKVARCIVETTPGMYWIATEDGGLNIYDSTTGNFTTFNNIPQLGTNVHSLYFDHEHNEMWIGTFRNGLFRYNMSTHTSKQYIQSNGHNLNSVFSIVRQKNGTIWIATTLGLFKYDSASDGFVGTGNVTLDHFFIYCLAVDKQDNIWAGSAAFGLFCIDSKGKITNWTKTEQKSQIKDCYVTCVFPDSRGTIWIGTNNNGVQYLKGNEFVSLQSDVLSETSCVCSINEDRDGHLWISTSQGLYRYNMEKMTMSRFTIGDGLPTNQFNFSSSLLTSTGDMFFGTVNGLVNFQPSKMGTNSEALKVHFFDLEIKNLPARVGDDDSPLTKSLDLMDIVELSYDQASSFSLEFGVIMPFNNESVEYQIWVEGIDKKWHSANAERKFSGYKLSPGKYTIHVRANDNSRDWNDCPERVIKIKVLPPFYRSDIAYILYFILLVLIVYGIYRNSLERIRERNAASIANMEKEQLARLDQAKFDFFTAVSHELKTPLSLIVAPLKLLSKQNLDDESQKNLDIAIKNTKKVEGLINELVTFNKIETDKFPFYVQKGNPLEFIQLDALTFKELSSEKSIALTVYCENNGEEVWFSPSYVERILGNLLSNAIKFTPEGGSVNVKASIVTVEGDNYTYLQLQVSDTGIGIAKEELENIFGRYYQTKRGYTANNSGWGIGLSLVKRLTDVHKGNIKVESELSKGSTFTVLLNVSADAFPKDSYITDDKVIVPISEYKFSQTMSDLSSSTTFGSDTSADEGKAKILIVDDNSDLLNFLASYFSREYSVLTATNGREALDLACTEQIQLVISDVMMPEMDGVELCGILKKDMQTSHIPVILLTAKSQPDDVLAGYKSGAEAYVSKPFEPEILELQIKNILALQKVRQTEIVNSIEPDVVTQNLTSLDRDFIKNINDVIEKNLSNSDFSISDITDELCVSRSLLHLKMKSLMAMSTGDYIRKKRLDKACELLRDSHSVADTAYKTGFSDPNYFSKVFKKVYGISPTEFINNAK